MGKFCCSRRARVALLLGLFATAGLSAANEPGRENAEEAAQLAEPAVTASVAPSVIAKEVDPLEEFYWRTQGGQPAAQAAPAAAESEQAEPAVPGIDVWERIRRGFAMPELTNRAAVNMTRWYAERPDYVDRMAGRASLYLFHIVEEVEKRGMPTELALLPFVESAMQPEAESHARAVGLWQFIPSTGRLYSLEQNLWKDDRRDVLESTRAALDYLQKLYNDFGDWHLVLAAYNCGEGCVGRAVARNQARRQSIAYTHLRLPRETQFYVPKLQAIKNIVRDPQRYYIELPAIRNEPYFVAVGKTRDIDVTTAAKLAEMPLEEFRALNPAFNRPVIIGAAKANILLPADRAEVFAANLAAFEATGQALASWTAHTLGANETLAQVADRVGVSEANLREANRIPPRYRIAAGSTILIPRDETMEDDISADLLDARFSLVPERANLRKVTYRVRRGDTLYGVARRWRVDPDEIIAWNNLSQPELFAGQRLTLTVARAPAAAKPARAKARSSSSRVAAGKSRGTSPAAVVRAR